jgi:DNA-directed RNA polymerase specialized sigma24 family protein
MKSRGRAAIQQLDLLFRGGSTAGLSDGELLRRAASADREGADIAFETLVRLHGPMVLATCRGVLRNEHDAEDAFQATFLILARRAGSLRNGDRLGPWLHRVALRASERARVEAARRRRHEAG